MSNQYTGFKAQPRDWDVTQYNSLLLYDKQGRKHIQQQKTFIEGKEQSQGIRIVQTNQPKDTFRTLDPNKMEKEERLFQNKKQIHSDHPPTKDNIFGAYYPRNTNDNNISTPSSQQQKQKTNQLNLHRSSSQAEPLNLFAPDNNPPVYSTLNKNESQIKPEHFQKRLIKQNEYKMYDYGSSVNLPNQQVAREPTYDASQTTRQVHSKAHVRKYQLDVTSSIDCLPGVFFKSPQQFQQAKPKEDAFIKRQLMSSREKEIIDGPKLQKPKINVKNLETQQDDQDNRPTTKRQYDELRTQFEQQFELKDNQQPIANPKNQFAINKFKTQVNEESRPSNVRMNFYKTNFVLG